MESNLDGDCVAAMEEIDSINNRFSCSNICGLSNCEVVGVDSPVSSVCCPVTDNNYMAQNSGDDDTVLRHDANPGIGGNNASLFVGSSNSFKLVSNYSVEVATKRIFRLGHVHVFSHLKTMAHQFGMKWNFVTTRNGRRISYNRVTRYSNRKSQGDRKCSSIICGCDWVVRFKFLDHKTRLCTFVGFTLILVIQCYVISRLLPEQKQVNTKNVLTLLYRKQCIKCLLIRKLMSKL